MTYDEHKRVKYSEVKKGDILEISGMECIKTKKILVQDDGDGCYVECLYGAHYLEKCVDCEDYLIGFRRAKNG
jgi:hypothetical protein